MKPTVRFVIADTYMGLSHDGLREVIRQHKKKNPLFARTMQQEGGLILFVNKAQNKLKLFSESTDVIGYLRIPGSRGIDEDTINLVPASFGGSLELSRATKNALKAFLEDDKKRLSRPSPTTRTMLLEGVM